MLQSLLNYLGIIAPFIFTNKMTEQDLIQQRILIEKMIQERYKPSLVSIIGDAFEDLMKFMLVLVAMPFLALIQIFRIIFNRK